MKKMMKEGIQEDIDALLSGENLSEDFVTKASTIFEAAVMSRVEQIAEQVEKQLQEQFDSALEEVKEERIETICPIEKTKSVIKAIKQFHPYEEPAFDIYPLINEDEL